MTFIRYWTVADYAAFKGLSERWVYQQIKEGKLDARKVPPMGRGNHYWIIAEEVEEKPLKGVN